MVIKNIVLSGGGYFGLYQLGVLKYLNEVNFYNIKNIKSIYSTSVGSIIGAMLLLKIPINDIIDYIVKKPWHKYITLEASNIIDIYYNRGILDKSFFTTILEPLLKSVELSISTTMKEFYDYTNVKLCICVYNLDKNKYEILDFIKNPELLLMDAIYMSCCIPYVFQPVKYNNCYYIDGGIENNYAVKDCIENEETDKNEILGISVHSNQKNSLEEENILNYSMFMIRQLIKRISNQTPILGINEVIIPSSEFSLVTLMNTIKEKEQRQSFIETGYNYAQVFYHSNQAKNE